MADRSGPVAPVQPWARLPFFYGWLIVAVAVLAMMAGGGGLNYSFGALMSPMSQELGWSRSQISGAITLAGVMGALSGPFFGRLIDRAGGRGITAVCAVLGGLVLLGVSRASHLWQLYLLYGVMLGPILPGVTLAATTAVANWFIRGRAQATFIASLGVPIGGFAVLPLTQALISALGWRAAWVGLAAIMGIGLTIPALLFLRRRPEDIGLLPDGDRLAAGADLKAHQAALAASLAREPRWTARQAMRTSSFWLLIITFSLTFMGVTAFVTNGQSHFLTAGASARVAAIALSIFAFGTLTSRLLWAPIAARLGSRRGLVLVIITSAVGYFAIAFARSPASFYASSALLGLCLGALNPLSMQVWPDYYGRLSTGTVRGVAQPFLGMVGALGPFLASGISDLTNSYKLAFALFGVTFLMASVFMFFARQPALPLPPAAPRPVDKSAAPT